MNTHDPRVWALTHPQTVLLWFVVISALMVWGNWQVQRSGMFAGDVILRDDDLYRRMDRYVHEEKHHQGFDGEEMMPFFLNSGVRSAADLEQVLHFSEEAKRVFGNGILSLAEIPAFRDDGITFDDTPYITQRRITAPDFRIYDWKKSTTTDPGVFGVLVARDFAWAAIVRYLPPGYDEIAEFRRTAEFLEGRPIPWWEWRWKTDITPRNPAVGVGGWVIGRGMLDQGLNVDMLKLVALGVVAALLLFRVLTGSWSLTWLAVGVLIGGGFLWTRGGMGVMGIDERVFSVLVYANVIVLGTSFALHKLRAFAESGTEDCIAGWRAAMHVDWMIAIAGGVAIYGFFTLRTFDLAPIRELGLASTLGVVLSLVLAVFVLPAFGVLLGGKQMRRANVWQHGTGSGRIARWVESAMEGTVRYAVWLAHGHRPWLVVTGVVVLFAVVAVLFGTGQIESKTRALEFLRGTSVERQARFLNQPGNIGFEFLDMLVEPAHGGKGIYDPQFLARAWAYQQALRGIPDTRETASILGTIQRISQESFKKPFPDSVQEIQEAWYLIEAKLSRTVQRQLYFPGGVRVSVSYGFDDSVRLARFCEAALALAREHFSDLQVSVFNTVPIYSRADLYVRQGKVWNVFTSQGGVAVICALLLWWGNRSLGARRVSPIWGGLVMSLPLFFATGLLGVVMWLLAIPLDMATASIGALAINAATDFSLYLALAYQTALAKHGTDAALPMALHSEGKVIVMDCVLNILCFLPLLWSSFDPIAKIGWMMGVMLVACAIGTLFGMAVLLPRCVYAHEART